MQATHRDLLSVLGEEVRRFVIPVYQRKYTWERSQWERLWEDIIAIASCPNKKHFTGSIVWVDRLQGPGTTNEGNVLVDGQQRLTTLSLIILAYAEYAKAHDNKSANGDELLTSFKHIINKGYLIEDEKKGEQRYKLTLSDVDKEIFHILIEHLLFPDIPIPKNSGSKLPEALEYFRSKVATMSDQNILWQGIKKLSIVNVALDSEDNPQLVFESMNSTGKRLSQADLIRNFILLGLSMDKQTTLYNNYWREIEKYLETDQDDLIFDKFIFHYLTIYTAPAIVSQEDIFQVFKNKFNNNDPEVLLKDLKNYAEIYSLITKWRYEEDPEINKIFKNISILKATPFVSLIMQLYHEWKFNPTQFSREEFINSIKIIEVYLVYRILCDYSNQGFNRYIPSLMSKLMDRIKNNDFSVSRYLLATFEDERGTSREFPATEKVISYLKTKNFYDLAYFRKMFFFEHLENFKHPKYNLNIANDKELTIEHIMPKTINENTDWPHMLGVNYKNEYENYLNLLGNLTITKNNSNLSNKSFADKKEIYNERDLIKLTIEIANEDCWNFDKIIKRTDILSNMLVKIWPKPSINQYEIKKYSLIDKDIDYISIKDLLIKGILQINDLLVTPSNSIYKGIQCKINEEGRIEFEDGKSFDNPTGAAKFAMKKLGKPEKTTNGWRFWYVPRLNCQLYETKYYTK